MPTNSDRGDEALLLVAYTICADGQLHYQEAKALRELAELAGTDSAIVAEANKILDDAADKLPLEAVAARIPKAKRAEAINQMLAIAYIDGYCSPPERKLVEYVARLWKFPEGKIEEYLKSAGAFSDTSWLDSNDDRKLSFGARFLRGMDSVLSRSLVNKLADIAPKNVGEQVEKLRREILLSGPEYDEAIAQCATVAKEDYRFAERALKHADSSLANLEKNLESALNDLKSMVSGKGEKKQASEVLQQLNNTRKDLTVTIIKEMLTVRESLKAKQRSLGHFGIAFMGKTKVGKSTLHAVMTGEGWEAIGVGKQRTTRLNRVYEWKNIRIIDTPGIGAPGGKTDEEIARSVIDEADVICFVVTNDSIQKSEFDFMGELKKNAKPLIVLLNVKHNLSDPRRLAYFLKDPSKPFAMEGKNGLQGHLDRIRRYVKQFYGNDYFDIVPVMLIAAQLSRQPEYEQDKDRLFNASRMPDFLDSIRESLIQHGTIRRSQTLLGSTVSKVEHPYFWVQQHHQAYTQLTETLAEKRKEVQIQIKKAAQDSHDRLKQSLDELFQDLENAVNDFADRYWNKGKSERDLGWKRKLAEIKFDDRLRQIYQDVQSDFSQEVREILEEIGRELELVAQLDRGYFQFSDVGGFEIDRSLVDKTSIFLGVAIIVAPLLGASLPVVLSLSLGALAIGAIRNLVKSKQQKQQENVQAIQDELLPQIASNKEKTLTQVSGQWNQDCANFSQSIDRYFQTLIAGLEAISQQFDTTEKELKRAITFLNRAYAKRILDWYEDRYEPLTEEGINGAIARVKRTVGREMTIVLKRQPIPKKKLADSQKVLQESLTFKVVKSSH